MSFTPLALAGAIAVTIGGAAPMPPAPSDHSVTGEVKAIRIQPVSRSLGTSPGTEHASTVSVASKARITAAAPASYTVAKGDTISGIAARFGISTAAILSTNGIVRSSLIFPGQVLRLGGTPSAATGLPAAPTSTSTSTGNYTVLKGDTVSRIAARLGVSTAAMLTTNGLGWSSVITPGQSLRLPGAGAVPAQAASTIAPVVAVTHTEAPAPAVPAALTHVVTTGDTVSGIARAAGTSIQALLAANGLNRSSIIYPGQRITLPAAQLSVVTPTSSDPAALTAEMRGNIKTIISVGRSLGVPDRGIVVALAAAAQESGLRNVHFGDRDSLGLFQQRPSKGWGSAEQVMDPARATAAFFGGSANPNKGITRGLLDIPGWNSMTVTDAAQAVQISAYPAAYGKWETAATAWFAASS